MDREIKEKRFHEMMQDQCKQMLIDLEKDSKKAGRNLRNENYFFAWISKNAEKFREIWESNHKE